MEGPYGLALGAQQLPLLPPSPPPTGQIQPGNILPAALGGVNTTQPSNFSSLSVTGENQLCQGRLTLTSGTPVTTSNVIGASTIYWTPYKGNLISLYDGISIWRTYSFSELSYTLSALTTGLPFDVFAYISSGAVALQVQPWTSSTVRNFGLTISSGVYVRSSGTPTLRYLGTFYTTGTTTTEDSENNRYVFNYYNRVPRRLLSVNSNGSWSYSTSTWREANGGTGQTRAQWVTGVSEDAVNMNCPVGASNGNSSSNILRWGIGVDSTTGPSGPSAYFPPGYSGVVPAYQFFPAIGFHYGTILEKVDSGSGTFFGTEGGSALYVNLFA